MITKEYVDQRTVFSTVTGSVSYGTNTPESDTDIRGIAIMDDPRFYHGYLDRFEQFESKEPDITIYNIRKAFQLIADANPNMLELLFTELRFHNFVHPVFEQVLAQRDAFLSRKVCFTYTGYAHSQIKRLRNARSWLLNPPTKKPDRADFGLPEKTVLTKDDINAFYTVMAFLLKDTVAYFNFTEETKKELNDANWIGLIQSNGIPNECFDEAQKISGADDAWMEALRREQSYGNAKRHYDEYLNWKNNRNKKRAALEEKFGFDSKFGAHAVRLLRSGKEILETGKVMVFRPDREELLAIRNGAWPFEQLEEYATQIEKEVMDLYKTSALPKEPNRVLLNQLCVKTIEDYINR